MTESVDNCTHHWLIEPANGPTSVGVCQECGAEAEFQNYIGHESQWVDQTRTEEKGEANDGEEEMPILPSDHQG